MSTYEMLADENRKLKQKLAKLTDAHNLLKETAGANVKDHLAAQDSEVARQLAESQDAAEALRKDLDVYKQDLESAEKNIKRREGIQAELEATVEGLNDKIKGFEDAAATHKATLQRVTAQRDEQAAAARKVVQPTEAWDKLVAERDTLKLKLEETEELFNGAMASKETLTGRLAEAEKQIADLEVDGNQEVVELRDKLEDAKSTLDVTKASLAGVTRARDAYADELDAKVRELTQLQEASVEVDMLRDALDSARGDHKITKDLYQELLQNYEAVQTERDAVGQKYAALQQDLFIARERVEKLEGDNDRQAGDLATLKEKADGLDEELQNVRKDRARQSDVLKKNLDSIQTLQSELEVGQQAWEANEKSFRNAIAREQDKVQTLTDERDGYQAANMRLHQELGKQAREAGDTCIQLNDEGVRQERDDAVAKADALRTERNATEKENESLGNHNAVLTSENEKLRERNRKLEADCKTFTGDLEDAKIHYGRAVELISELKEERDGWKWKHQETVKDYARTFEAQPVEAQPVEETDTVNELHEALADVTNLLEVYKRAYQHTMEENNDLRCARDDAREERDALRAIVKKTSHEALDKWVDENPDSQ